MLVDNDVLIDAGTGIGDLALEEIDPIRHVFLTHAHLDHIAGLPMLADSVFDENFTVWDDSLSKTLGYQPAGFCVSNHNSFAVPVGSHCLRDVSPASIR